MAETKITNNPNTNIQLPKQMAYNNGESVVKKSSGLIRIRKGQSETEFNSQKEAFWITGPVVQNHTFLTQYVENLLNNEGDNNPDILQKSKNQRENMLHALERLYFQRNFEQCLDDIQKIKNNVNSNNPDLNLNLKTNKNLKRILNELDNMEKMCIEKLNAQNESKLNNL